MLPGIFNYPSYLAGDTILAERMTMTETITGENTPDDDVTTPVDLTGITITCDFVSPRGYRISKSMGNGILILDAQNGVFVLEKFSIDKPGIYRFDVQFKMPNNDVRTYVSGTINIVKDVTKIANA